MTNENQSLERTAEALASAYVNYADERNGESQAASTALASRAEDPAVFQQVLDNKAHMFVSVLKPQSAVSLADLERRSVGLVGAGEALSALVVRGDRAEATETLALLIQWSITSKPLNMGSVRKS